MLFSSMIFSFFYFVDLPLFNSFLLEQKERKIQISKNQSHKICLNQRDLREPLFLFIIFLHDQKEAKNLETTKLLPTGQPNPRRCFRPAHLLRQVLSCFLTTKSHKVNFTKEHKGKNPVNPVNPV